MEKVKLVKKPGKPYRSTSLGEMFSSLVLVPLVSGTSLASVLAVAASNSAFVASAISCFSHVFFPVRGQNMEG